MGAFICKTFPATFVVVSLIKREGVKNFPANFVVVSLIKREGVKIFQPLLLSSLNGSS
jgi:hypothetical protein